MKLMIGNDEINKIGEDITKVTIVLCNEKNEVTMKRNK